jgi:hypothetical protein
MSKTRYNLRPIRRRHYNKTIDKINKVQPTINRNKLYKRKVIRHIFDWKEFNKLYRADGITKHNEDMEIEYVSPSSIKNYLLKDPCLDWIKHTTKRTKEERDKLQYLFKMGNQFEEQVMKEIRTKYPSDHIRISTNIYDLTEQRMNDTVNAIYKGIPIIEQAVLYNHKNRTYGIADILIRSDYINKLFNKKILDDTNKRATKLKGNYHYVVIDIKWTTLELCVKDQLIRNSQRFPAYKGQLAIYNSALGLIQGYTPSKAYILAKGWKVTKKNKTTRGNNCFDLLGVVDFSSFDNKYLDLTSKAIKWIRDIRYNGHQMELESNTNLYPNMCNKYDNPYFS